jgi:putative FmdB family regulatory protein
MTYIYECSNCGRFELQQSIKDSPIEVCPTCGSSVRRIITGGTGVIYKCGGFYSKPVHFNTDNVSEPKVID